MDQITRIFIDTSKQFFQLHGVDAQERVVLRRQLRRAQMGPFFARLAPTVVAMEACGASHHWARVLGEMGHAVKLIAPQLVKPYVSRGKNDARDAEGGCEAMSRPRMRYVPVKTAEQQAALMLLGVRDALARERTQLTNTIRGYASEFGLVAPRGLDKIDPLLARIAGDESLPALARDMFASLGRGYAGLQARFKEIDARLMAWHRADAASVRLARIPGVGPIGASMLVMKTPEPKRFKSGRAFSAWMGLTPKDHSTAGRQKLGVITRAGDEALRSVLVSGAMAVVRQVKARQARTAQTRTPEGGGAEAWLVALLERKAPKEAAVALANRTARIAWRMMTTGEVYDATRRGARPAAMAA